MYEFEGDLTLVSNLHLVLRIVTMKVNVCGRPYQSQLQNNFSVTAKVCNGNNLSFTWTQKYCR